LEFAENATGSPTVMRRIMPDVRRRFLFAFFVGLAPLGLRLLVHVLFYDNWPIQAVLISDLTAWGLVLNIVFYNEGESFFRNGAATRGSVMPKISVALIVAFSVVFTLGLINDVYPIFRLSRILAISVLLSGATLVVCIIYLVKNREELKGMKE